MPYFIYYAILCFFCMGSAFATESAPKAEPDVAEPAHLLNDRIAIETLNRSNRFILTPHKRNYLVPFSYSHKPNTEPYEQTDSVISDLDYLEAEFQLSVKILLRENIFDDNGHLYLGYTHHALWQVYNRRLSAPFRESNHQPELILGFINDWEIFGFKNVLNDFTFNHQSNGQPGLLSRSWNRLMFTSVFEKGNFAFALNPWYRLPEDPQKYPGDPSGDDNSDITNYMGNFELSCAYKYKADIFSLLIRNNLNIQNRGAIELSWTFPVTKTLRGYMSFFDGYGHSLIDYNERKQVIGLGIIFTDLF
jgi:phospholipase A1/A2